MDRSAPDGGADNIIVSGDSISPPVIGPITPVPPTPSCRPAMLARTASRPSATMSVAGALSAADQRTVPHADPQAEDSDLPARPLSLVPQGDERLGAGPDPAARDVPAHARRRAVQLHAAAGRPVQGHVPEFAVANRDAEASKVTAPFPFSLTGGPYYEGRLFEGGVDKGGVTLAWVSSSSGARRSRSTRCGAVRPAPVPDGAGGTEFFDTIFAKTGWQLRVSRTSPTSRCRPAWADQLLELRGPARADDHRAQSRPPTSTPNGACT